MSCYSKLYVESYSLIEIGIKNNTFEPEMAADFIVELELKPVGSQANFAWRGDFNKGVHRIGSHFYIEIEDDEIVTPGEYKIKTSFKDQNNNTIAVTPCAEHADPALAAKKTLLECLIFSSQ